MADAHCKNLEGSNTFIYIHIAFILSLAIIICNSIASIIIYVAMNNEYKSAKLSFDEKRYKIITRLKFMNVGIAGVILIVLQVYL